MQESHREIVTKMNSEFVSIVDSKNKHIEEMKLELADVRSWLKYESTRNEEKSELEEELEAGRAKKRAELALIKKERAGAIEKLRKEMLMNIRNVKIKMLSMNEDEL